MYLGSVRFFRHLILVVCFFVCVIPIACAAVLGVQLHAVRRQLDSAETARADLSAALVQISSEEARLGERLDSLILQTAALQKHLDDSLGERTAALRTQLEGALREETAALRKRLSAIDEKIAALRQQLDASLGEQAAAFRQESDSISGEIAALEEQLRGIDGKIDALRAPGDDVQRGF